VKKKKKKKEKGKGRKADLLTLTVMLVAVERKPTFMVVMTVVGSVCCSFSSSSPCREPASVVFFHLLLFGSSPFGLWWGWSCWWLSDGAVEVAGRWSCCGGRWWLFSSLCRGVSLCSFFFLLLIDTPFSVAALWQRWIGKPTVVLLFPSFFLCNFLSPRLISAFFFLCFPFPSASCLYRLPLSVSIFPPHCLVPFSVFLFFVVQCWCGCDGEWQWLLDEEDELTMALAVLVQLSPLLYSFPCRSSLVFPLVSSFFFFLSVLFCSPQVISVFPPYIPLSLCLFFFFPLSLFSPPPGFGLSSGFYSQRMHALLHEYSNGRRALVVKRSL